MVDSRYISNWIRHKIVGKLCYQTYTFHKFK